MIEALTAALMLLGSALMFVAAVGIVRFPDLFTRMQAATKAGSVGLGLLLGAGALAFDDAGVTAAALLVILFILLTAPVAAHAIARAAYFSGVPRWSGTVLDELDASLRRGRAEAPAAPPEEAKGTPGLRGGPHDAGEP